MSRQIHITPLINEPRDKNVVKEGVYYILEAEGISVVTHELYAITSYVGFTTEAKAEDYIEEGEREVSFSRSF